MFAASYVGTRSGIMGLGNIFIRLRICEGGQKWKQALQLNAIHGQTVLRASHTELVFEPGDGVDDLMPDGTCEPDADGALWCLSSTGLEHVHPESIRRAGKLGGVRFKRINVHNAKWQHQPIRKSLARRAATWGVENSGRLYDWQLILSFLSWLIPQKASRLMCNETVLTALGVKDAFRYDPCSSQPIFDLLA